MNSDGTKRQIDVLYGDGLVAEIDAALARPGVRAATEGK